MTRPHTRTRRWAPALTAALLAPGLAACSLLGESGSDDPTGDGARSVVLLTHQSFALPDDLVAQFEAEHDATLEVRQPGDAGTLVTEIALNADDPGADVVFGVDNTFASRLLESDAVVDYHGDLPAGAEAYALDDPRLVPIDSGDVCVNVDTAWFEEEGIDEPETLADLTEPEYRGLFVTPGPTDSSPGLAFLLATIAEFGEDGWQDYWSELLANDTEVVSGWDEAYYGAFTGGGEDGTKPIVLSYASSPAFTVDDDGEASSTRALLDACFAQTEFAGVLQGADQPELAQELVTWLLSEPVQSSLPEQMYVYPVREDATLPAEWADFAPRPDDAHTLPAEEIASQREEWIGQWRELIE